MVPGRPGYGCVMADSVAVLVCDTDPDARLLFRTVCELRGARVIEVDSIDEAVARAGAERPSVVLADLAALDGDTGDALRRLTSGGGRVYVVGARMPPLLAQDLLAAGATACFEKRRFAQALPHVLDAAAANGAPRERPGTG